MPPPTAFDAYKQTQHFGALDGMRAIGVVLVIFDHYGGEHLKLLSGWLGVHVFFVMSGFLITTLLLREQEKLGQVSLMAFYVRRSFRILPVYYLILLIVTIQTKALGGESWEQLKHAFFYYATFLNEQKFVAPWKLSWTMGIEWKFYLVWPIVAFLLPLRPLLVMISAFATIAALGYFWSSPIVRAPHYIVLMLGAVIAILLHNQTTFKFFRWMMNPIASFVLMGCVVTMQLYGIHHIPGTAGGYGGALGVLLYGIVVALFLPTLFGTGVANEILRSRPFVFVGQRSYSLYLVQILAWQALVGMDPTMRVSPIGAILTTLVGLIFADVLYRYVEQPFISFGKRILQSRKLSSAKLNSPITSSA